MVKYTKIFLLLTLLALLPALQAADKQYLNVVFIGNSITYGAGLPKPLREAPPVKAAIYLGKQPGIGSVRYSNQGVSGATTVDFLPETHTLFDRVTAAADQFKDEDWATLVFSVMLGTNDSAIRGTNGCPVSPEQYRKNLSAIVDRLLVSYPGCRIVLHRPIWYSPNTHNGAMYLQEGLSRLKSYFPEIKRMVKDYSQKQPGRVFLGDTEAFDYFRKHSQELFQAEDGNSGVFYLHPNPDGAVRLGEYWGKAIYRVVSER